MMQVHVLVSLEQERKEGGRGREGPEVRCACSFGGNGFRWWSTSRILGLASFISHAPT